MASQHDVRKEMGARVSDTAVEPFRLAALGTATYLSYWTLFFSVCRACVGGAQRVPQADGVSRHFTAT